MVGTTWHEVSLALLIRLLEGISSLSPPILGFKVTAWSMERSKPTILSVLSEKLKETAQAISLVFIGLGER